MSDWTMITAAIGTTLSGETERGRLLLLECWEATRPGDHAHRCVLAHYLADTEKDVDRELKWDETALKEHAFVHNGDLASLGIPSADGFLPSLHLNLADGYHRQGQATLAWKHLTAGQAATNTLHNDGYATMIRAGLDNLSRRLIAAHEQ